MSIKFSVTSPELQKQIELLSYFPEIAAKHLEPAMDKAAPIVEAAVRPNVPVKRGQLAAALGSIVILAGLNTRAQIGFGKKYGKPSATYAAAVNYGAKPHEIVAGTRSDSKNLMFSSEGRFTKIGSVQHPGFTGYQFMDTGFTAALPAVTEIMDAAVDDIVKELAA